MREETRKALQADLETLTNCAQEILDTLTLAAETLAKA